MKRKLREREIRYLLVVRRCASVPAAMRERGAQTRKGEGGGGANDITYSAFNSPRPFPTSNPTPPNAVVLSLSA